MAKVIVASHAGFCFGVKRAVNSVFEIINNEKQIYTYGELIHNNCVIDLLRKKGVIIARSIQDIINPKNSLVVIRSHGVSPDIYKEIDAVYADILDLTCPFVKRIHNKVFSIKNKPVIIIGTKNHPEVIGICGWAQGRVSVIGNEQEALEYPKTEKALVVAQTTITVSLWNQITSILKRRVRELEVFESICDTTKKRQDEAVNLASKSDIVYVIGGKHSSNTEKLFALCRQKCAKTYHIESSKEILLENISNSDIITIVAGASTPDWLIREVRRRMSDVETTQDFIRTEDIQDEAAQNTIDAETAVIDESDIPDLNVNNTETVEDSIDHEKTDNDDFIEALEKSLNPIKKGQILTGTVVQVSDNEICVNLGRKSDGIIKKEELSVSSDVNPHSLYKVGDEIDAEVTKTSDGEGNILLSRRNIENKLKWIELIENLDDKAIYNVKVDKVVKGGVLAKLNGYDAFIPASQLSLKYVEDLSEFVNQEISVNIIEVDKRQRRFVLSHKNVLQKLAEENEKKLYENFKKGDKIKGKVKRLTDFGAFVDIGGIDGLLHITDIAWARVKHPSEIINVGDEIEVLILNVDSEKKRISLGLKQLLPKPWDLAPQKYIVGNTVEGEIVRIMPFGAFVSLEPTIDGLIHISQVTNRRLEKVEEELRVGDKVKAKIMEVNPAKKRISLSVRALLDSPDRDKSLKIEKDENQERFHYEIPPVEEATSSLADFFPKTDDEA